MRSARVAAGVGRTAKVIASHFTLLSFLLAGALVACGGSSGTTTTPPAITLQSIAVAPGNATIAAGTTQQFTATGTFSDSSTGAVSGLVWSSSNPAIAAIDASGMVTGVAGSKGTATITASSSGVSGRSSITVTVAPLVSVTVAASPGPLASLPMGLTQQFVAIGHFADLTTAQLTSGVTWSTSDFLATVSATGLATAVAAGPVDIIATDDATQKFGKITLNVSAAVLQGITLSPAPPSAPAGFSTSLSATAVFSDQSTSPLLASSLTWATKDATIATVSTGAVNPGLVHGVAPGAVHITATEPVSGIVGDVVFTVTAAQLQSITVAPSLSPSVFVGAHMQFTASGVFSDSQLPRPLANADVTWASDATGVATINGGLALGVAQGTANITAAVGAVASAPVLLTVNPAPQFTQLVFGQDFPFTGLLDAGGTNRYQVTGLTANSDYLVNLTSSDSSVQIRVFADNSFSAAAQQALCNENVNALLPACRGAVATGPGEIFIEVSGPSATSFTFEVLALPVVQAGTTTNTITAGAFSETYFRIEGLTPGATFTAKLGEAVAGTGDPGTDLLVFSVPTGNAGEATQLCSTVLAGTDFPNKTCTGTVPLNTNGVVYVTVASANGMDFTVLVQ